MTDVKEPQVAQNAYEVRPASNGVELYVRGRLEGVFDNADEAHAYMAEPAVKKPRKPRFASGARA